VKAEDVRQHADLVDALLRLAYLRPDQAGIIVGVSASSIRRACAAGELNAHRLGAKCWRITPDALRAWVERAHRDSTRVFGLERSA